MVLRVVIRKSLQQTSVTIFKELQAENPGRPVPVELEYWQVEVV